MKYKINEIFQSMQGEGFNQGKKVVFIRLSGCNLKCAWCDTDHNNYTEFDVYEILSIINKYNEKSVIITGGEPTIYDLKPLIDELKKEGYWIGIETNGTNNLEKIRNSIDYISMSPKGKPVNLKCDELRMVNDNLTCELVLKTAELISARHYYLSPLEIDGFMNIERTMELIGEINVCSENEWRISLQLHKFAGIR